MLKVVITCSERQCIGELLMKAFICGKWKVVCLIHDSNAAPLVMEEISRGWSEDAGEGCCTSPDGRKICSSASFRCNLDDFDLLKEILSEIRPDVVIHSAGIECVKRAEVEKELSDLLHVRLTDNLAHLCEDFNSWLLFLSSNMVFDGRGKGQYSPNSPQNPLTYLGKSKMEGEKKVWETKSDAGILRVPMLYGPVDKWDDSEITSIAKMVLESSTNKDQPKEIFLDDSCILHPTNGEEVASICLTLANKKIEHCGLYGTWHWTGNDELTSFALGRKMAEILGVSDSHIKPAPPPPSDPSPEPINARLNCIALEVMTRQKRIPFTDGISPILKKLQESKSLY